MGEMLKPEERWPLKPLGFPLTMNPGQTKYWISWDGNRLDNAGYPIPIYFQSNPIESMHSQNLVQLQGCQ
jgi:hypothetical protein